VIRGLLAYLYASPRWDWNPLSWASKAEADAAKDLEKAYKSLWRWVVNECTKLGNLVQTDITDVYSNMFTLVRSVDGNITDIWAAVYRLGGSVKGDVSGFVKAVVHDVESEFDSAVKGAESLTWSVWRTADGWYHDALRTAEGDVEAFYHKVIVPLARNISHDITNAEKEADKIAEAVYHDVLLKIAHDAEEGYAEAVKAVYWIDHTGYDAVRLVEECWDFLEAIALHPVTLARRGVKDWERSITVSGLEGIASGSQPLYAHVVKSIEDVL